MHGLEAGGFTIFWENWQATIAIDRNVVLLDKLNTVKLRIRELKRAAAQHYVEPRAAFVVQGFEKNKYKREYFFDHDRSMGTKALLIAAWPCKARHHTLRRGPC